MATQKLYDLAVKTGTYEVQGQTKGRWMNVGAVMQNDEGGKFLMLNRTFNPAGVPDLNGKGGESILVSMFEPKGRDSSQGGGSSQGSGGQPSGGSSGGAPPADDFDDDIPF